MRPRLGQTVYDRKDGSSWWVSRVGPKREIVRLATLLELTYEDVEAARAK